jgi:hypothetical protein
VTRRVVAVLTVTALLAGCGTAPRPSVGMKEYSGDVVYGDNALPPPPTSPPAAEPVPGFPGFIVPPVPRQLPPGLQAVTPEPSTTTTRTRGTAPPLACAEDDPLAVPHEEALITVPGPPRSATLPYRQTGTKTAGGRTTAVLSQAAHAIDGQTTLAAGTFRFNVSVTEAAMSTVTTYQVDQRGAQDGIGIVQIRTKDQVATDAFTPAAPITILPLPPVLGRTFTGTGADPIHQTGMTVYGKVIGKTRVNACGVPIEAWKVAVGTDPQTGQPSRIVSPTGTTTITGTYAVATQFGGLVVADDLTLEGSDAGGAVKIAQQSTTNKVPQTP